MARIGISHRISSNSLAAIAVAVCGVLLFSATSVHDASPASAAPRHRWGFKASEKCFMKKINKRRSRHGLRRLVWDKQLGYVARRHAGDMSRVRRIFHDDSLGREVTRWRRLGQNVGAGSRCAGLVKAFMHSQIHRANILGRWHFLGVGISRVRGRMYVQQIFEARHDPNNVYSYP